MRNLRRRGFFGKLTPSVKAANYEGSATALIVACQSPAFAMAGSTAVFAGGLIPTAGGGTTAVQAYFDTLTRTGLAEMTYGRYDLAGATVNGNAVFTGGRAGIGRLALTEVYSASHVKSTPAAISSGRTALAGATLPGYAIFAGGDDGTTSDGLSIVEAYNISLAKVAVTAMGINRRYLTGAANASLAFFASNESGDSSIDVYNTSLVRIGFAYLTNAVSDVAGASTEKRAAFAGGGYTPVSTVDMFDQYAARTVVNLSVARSALAGAGNQNSFIFAGGAVGSTPKANVDFINSNGAIATITSLPTARRYLTGGYTGDRFLFVGGRDGSTGVYAVNEVYKFQ